MTTDLRPPPEHAHEVFHYLRRRDEVTIGVWLPDENGWQLLGLPGIRNPGRSGLTYWMPVTPPTEPGPEVALAKLFAREWHERRGGNPYPETLMAMAREGLIVPVRQTAKHYGGIYELTDLGRAALALAEKER